MAAKEFPLSIVIRAVDRATSVIRKVQNGVAWMDRQTVGRARAMAAAFSKWSGIDAAIGPAKKFGSALGDAKDRAVSLAKSIGGVLAVGAGLGALAIGSLIDTASQFEKFNAILTTLEGSSDKAAKSMQWVSDFAAKTPYELAEVTDAFVQLRSYGINPMDGALTAVGDVTAAKGKPLMQGVEAIADAITGQYERLRELSITASTKGNFVSLTYQRNGKWYERTVKKTNKAVIQSTILAIWNSMYAGAMDKLSQTWAGKMSNLADQWARFKLMIMQSGAFDWLNQKLGALLDKLNAMAASGELEKLANKIGKDLTDALKSAWDAGVKLYNNWDDIKAAVQPVVDVFTVLTNTFGTSNVIIGVVAGLIAATFVPALLSATAAAYQLSIALWSNPIGLIILLVLAVVAALVYFSVTIEDGKLKLTKFGEALLWVATAPARLIAWYIDRCRQGMENWGKMVDQIKVGFHDLFTWLEGKFNAANQWIADFANTLGKMIPDWAKGMFGGGPGPTVMGGAIGAAPSPRALALAPQKGEVTVKVDLNNLPVGSRVTTQQNGSPRFELNQGYALGGAY